MTQKEILKEKARRFAGFRINVFYQLYKQINLISLASGYTQQDLDTFTAFRDAVRARCDQYESDIDNEQTPIIDFSDIVP